MIMLFVFPHEYQLVKSTADCMIQLVYTKLMSKYKTRFRFKLIMRGMSMDMGGAIV